MVFQKSRMFSMLSFTTAIFLGVSSWASSIQAQSSHAKKTGCFERLIYIDTGSRLLPYCYKFETYLDGEFVIEKKTSDYYSCSDNPILWGGSPERLDFCDDMFVGIDPSSEATCRQSQVEFCDCLNRGFSFKGCKVDFDVTCDGQPLACEGIPAHKQSGNVAQ